MVENTIDNSLSSQLRYLGRLHCEFVDITNRFGTSEAVDTFVQFYELTHSEMKYEHKKHIQMVNNQDTFTKSSIRKYLADIFPKFDFIEEQRKLISSSENPFNDQLSEKDSKYLAMKIRILFVE